MNRLTAMTPPSLFIKKRTRLPFREVFLGIPLSAGFVDDYLIVSLANLVGSVVVYPNA